MLLDSAMRSLGVIDCKALTQRVLSLPDSVWHNDTVRQRAFNVHAQTQSIILLFCDGWPKVRIEKREGWEYLHQESVPIVREVLEKYYPPGGVILRSVIARLPAGCRIPLHRDTHPSFSVAHRIHIPLVTNSGVEFMVGKDRIDTQAHRAFELNNSLPHKVINRGASARIHFIFDYAPRPD